MPPDVSSKRIYLCTAEAARQVVFVCVGSFRPLSCIRHFRAVQSRVGEIAQTEFGPCRPQPVQASSNSALAASNVSPVPSVA